MIEAGEPSPPFEVLGFDAHFKTQNPAKWMAAANDTLELANFFEATNTSYEVNSERSSSKSDDEK